MSGRTRLGRRGEYDAQAVRCNRRGYDHSVTGRPSRGAGLIRGFRMGRAARPGYFEPDLGEDCMAYDLVIRNGTVVDGTGAKRYQADVAIAGGKVAEIGKVSEGAKRTIDAHGLVVAPGFVDPHTHYDAQICWDGAVTPSSWHGVT